MDYNQDFGVNRLHVLDDTNVSCDKNACAIFNGGIYVEKDIHAANIHIRNFNNNYLQSNLIDASSANITNLEVKNLSVINSLCPSDILTTATLGSCEKKWNGVHATNGQFQVVNTNTSNIKNLKYDNLVTVACVQNIPIHFNLTNDYVVELDKDMIFINIYDLADYISDSLITIRIPESILFYEHHKIVLNQTNRYKICWIIPGNMNFISDHNTQIYEIINIPNTKWKIINYLNSSNTNNYEQVCCSDSDSDSECDNQCLEQIDCSGTDISQCIKKTFVKYIYKQKDLLNDPLFGQMQKTIMDLNGIIIKQDGKINNLNKDTHKLEEQFDYLDSESKSQLLRINKIEDEKRHCNLSSSININDSNSMRRLIETVEDLTKTVKKNEKKIEDLDKKISNASSKMKKIIKYLNLD